MYKYDEDDKVTNFILRGLGKEPGYKGFVISMKMIQDARKVLKTSIIPKEVSMKIIQKATEKAQLIAEERDYDNHLAFTHNIGVKRFPCPYPKCDYVSKTKGNLIKHIKYKHNPNPTIFKCPEHNCDFQTKYKSSLNRHIRNKHR